MTFWILQFIIVELFWLTAAACWAATTAAAATAAALDDTKFGALLFEEIALLLKGAGMGCRNWES